jgi:membrane protease YdiL (CAAX protease family)
VWIGAGLLFGLAVLAVIRLLIEPVVPAAGARIVAAAELPLWRRAVVVYVAAVGEELVFRLILLSLVAGLAVRAFGADDGTSGPRLAWLANVVSALVFGAAHLQAWAAVGPLSLGRVMMVMTLNGLGGLLFGHLFLRRGIAPAMWAHAGADCAIQFVGPLTG